MKIFRCGDVYTVTGGEGEAPYSSCVEVTLIDGVKHLSGPMKQLVQDAIDSRKVMQRSQTFAEIAARSGAEGDI